MSSENPLPIGDSANSFQLALTSAYADAKKDLGRFNLALFGPTGVGKSTLLNTVFGVPLADVGVGKPVTTGSHLYRYETSTIGILDTRGLEVGMFDTEILTDLKRLLDAQLLQAESEHVHVAWYCVRAGSRRFQDSEESFVRKLDDLGLPVVLVLTQSSATVDMTTAGARTSGLTPEQANAVELAADIKRRRLPIVGGKVYPVNAVADEWMAAPAHGLDDLLAETSRVAPIGVRSALAAAQVVNRRQKQRQSERIVRRSAKTFEGKFLLRDVTGVWTTMVARISTVYGLPEAEAAAIIERSPHISRLRRMPFLGRTLLAFTVVTLPGLAFTFVTLPVAMVAGGTRIWRKFPRSKGEADPADVEPSATDTDEQSDPHKVRTGLFIEATTWAIGDAWLNTCDYFWQASYPGRPKWDSARFATLFDKELDARMPKVMRPRIRT